MRLLVMIIGAKLAVAPVAPHLLVSDPTVFGFGFATSSNYKVSS